jgi:phospholipid N-methyltransferase
VRLHSAVSNPSFLGKLGEVQMEQQTPPGYGLRFFILWLRDPFRIGAAIPSGKALARAMVAQIDKKKPGTIVELGGGTGVFTCQLLASGIKPKDLLVIEKTPELHALLTRTFPQLHITLGDAQDIRHHAAKAGLTRVKAVISGLPLVSMSAPIRERILDESLTLTGPEGIFVQFTYTIGSPVSLAVMQKLGITGWRVTRAWLNLPPAAVWVYRRAD